MLHVQHIRLLQIIQYEKAKHFYSHSMHITNFM
jgi:hypothetical protein